MKSLKADGWDRAIEPVVVAGIDVAPLSTNQWVELMLSDCRQVKGGALSGQYHTAINGNVVSAFASDAEFRRAIQSADAVAADGVSVMWGAKLFGRCPIPDRAATTDLFHDLARAAQDNGLSMYFLGSSAAENAAAVANVRAAYPRLKIAGNHHGYFNSAEEDAVVAAIIAAKPDILWVALGMPREDLFVMRNRAAFAGIGWIKTCGGLLNFLSGLRSRAPMWMQRAGLEWLYRMALEPRRLFWRYLSTNVHSIWLMATHKLRR
jgi:N-acetylglucosaminyldiphosphoundecaprenol N-acetyl-beta-D-mannosaminyltransferase